MTDNPYAATSLDVSKGAFDELPTDALSPWIGYIMLPLLITYGAISVIDMVGFLMYPTFTSPEAALVEGSNEMGLVLAQAGFGLLSLPLLLIECVLVCKFMYRANTNLRIRGVQGLSDTPGWACGYWFVPIMNLFKPFQAMKELDMASGVPIGQPWRGRGVDSSFGIWWAFWILAGVISNMEMRLSMQFDLGVGAPIISVTNTLVSVVAGWCLVVNVRKIQRKLSTQSINTRGNDAQPVASWADPWNHATD